MSVLYIFHVVLEHWEPIHMILRYRDIEILK